MKNVLLILAVWSCLLPAAAQPTDEEFLRGGSFIIRTARDYRYLTTWDTTAVEHSSIFSHSYTGNTNQQTWYFRAASSGFYRIQSGFGLYLSQKQVLNASTEPYSETDDQLWELIDDNNGYYLLRNRKGYYLRLNDRRNRDRGAIGFTTTRNRDWEIRWHLIKWSNDGRRVNSFDPVRHGFRFVNDFNGEDFIRWNGLCGGICYAALDFYHASRNVPTQTYMPANQTPLQRYFYDRHLHTINNTHEKWSELEVGYNVRGSEFYRWGLEMSQGGRLRQARDAVNNGRIFPLCLFGGGIKGVYDNDGKEHVVILVGYAMGRYTGNIRQHSEDVKLLIYDPNCRNTWRTLVPDRRRECYFEVETGSAWRTFFVNDRYNPEHVPPRNIPDYPENEPEGSVRNLYAEFVTGGDDLRGGNDNVSITIRYTDGTEQLFPTVNNKARWVDHSSQTVHLALNRPVRREDIREFVIRTSFGTDVFSDDWTVDGFYVTTGLGGKVYALDPLPGTRAISHRYSGDQRTTEHVVPRYND